MFLGEYQHSIDDKGRVIMPARFREQLGDSFIITRGLDGCLFVYPQEEWAKLAKEVQSLPLAKRDARAFSRLLFSGAAELECDKQGRVSIPSLLREYAQINKDVVIVGVSERLEIWAAERWAEISRDILDRFEELAEKLEGF
ncbi:MAG: division/cell wall cluster transcriptional repressor MraZ [Firmicutes bacterium]|nr:division/cell wall cluster transcriptional repressor MraZ [Bacillota bacterium]HOB34437.1 division/cell wall cluster transcriptional repressor MraZ [Bacillota bacterium]HPZ89823.1 division/cell wall cluster transcriptional repressor MraZ [Bacillota bacterium]HQE01161.1 division/cell wall cluster transcriptional repressor MraZ [Bacillota bacterium]